MKNLVALFVCCFALIFLSPIANSASALLPMGGCIGPEEVVASGSWPRYSPDGESLAYVAEVCGVPQVFVVRISTRKSTQVTHFKEGATYPDWLGDGATLVVSKVHGKRHELTLITLLGESSKIQLPSLPGDSLFPAVSPRFFQMKGLVPESCGGPYCRTTSRYQKILFEYREGNRVEVRFVTSDGKHQGIIEEGCGAPAWSGDATRVAMRCGEKVVFKKGAVFQMSDALRMYQEGLKEETLHEPAEVAEEVPEDVQENEWISPHLVPLFVKYDQPLLDLPAKKPGNPTISTNQMLVTLPTGTDGVVLGAAWSGADSTFTPLGVTSSTSIDWSPLGEHIVYTARVGEGHRILVATTTCPLQTVWNLPDYPELLSPSLPDSLQHGGFAALLTREKELFHVYEKVRYLGRGILVTPDAVLQAFSDVFSRLLQDSEVALMAQLDAFAKGALDATQAIPDKAQRIYVATLLGAAHVYFATAVTVTREQQEFEPEWGEEQPQEDFVTKGDKLAQDTLQKEISALPRELRKPVKALTLCLAKGELIKITVPGHSKRVLVDASLTQPRGHYSSPGYAQYFRGLALLGLYPLPASPSILSFVSQIRKDPANWQRYLTIRGRIAALAGPEAFPSLFHLSKIALRSKEARSSKGVGKALRKLFGKVAVRSAHEATGDDTLFPYFFPGRVMLDTEVFARTTHPVVPYRAFPSSLDMMAAFGNPLALNQALAPLSKDQTIQYAKEVDGWSSTFTKTRRENKGDLSSLWLQMLGALANGRFPDDAHFPPFATAAFYPARLLMTALAGFAQLKHHLVLYSFQNMGVECDAAEVVTLLYEVPELPEPPTYVEPAVDFYETLATLCTRTAALFDVEEDDPESLDEWAKESGEWRRPIFELARVAIRLHRISLEELAGKPLAEEDREFIRTFGGTLESFMLGTFFRIDSGMTGGDQGRSERGVTLVVDLYTNVQRQQILHNAVGRPLALYALVPYGRIHALAVGAMLSWYEFTHSQRLTDEQWWKTVQAGEEPSLPPWSAPFVVEDREALLDAR